MSIALPDSHPLPRNLTAWIAENQASFVPPVCNKLMTNEDTEFNIMLVGGPNTRTDYHIESGEEFFYQLKGDMCLKIVDGGKFRDVVIKEGECFLLPARVPHSPQRVADSMGLVIERKRHVDELDTMRWYCSQCRHIVYQQSFHCTDLGKQLAPVIRGYYASEELRTCRHCGLVDLPAGQNKVYDNADVHAQYNSEELAREELSEHPCSSHDHFHTKLPTVCAQSHRPQPLHLWSWIAQNSDKLLPPICNVMMFGLGCEFKIMIVGGPNSRTDYHVEDGEEWFYQLKGDMVLKIVDLNGNKQDIPIREGECFLLPANIPHSPQRFPNTLGLVIERERNLKESDHLRWYCRHENCHNIVFDKSFHCKDLGKELPPVIAEYYGSDLLRTCSKCGTADQRL